MFKYVNTNPDGANIDDCVVRSICKALNKPYWEVFDELCEVADSKDGEWDIIQLGVFGDYLKMQGWTCFKLPTRKRLSSVCKKYLDDGKFLVLVKDHMTYVENGNILDTWDCGRKIVIYIWYKEGD